MKKQTTAKPKAVPAAPKASAARPKRRTRSLEAIVGPHVYQTWVDMLHVLVPGGRTHRLAPLVAAMVQYALAVTEDARGAEEDEGSVAASLLATTEVGDPSEVKALLHDTHLTVVQVCRDQALQGRRGGLSAYQCPRRPVQHCR